MAAAVAPSLSRNGEEKWDTSVTIHFYNAHRLPRSDMGAANEKRAPRVIQHYSNGLTVASARLAAFVITKLLPNLAAIEFPHGIGDKVTWVLACAEIFRCFGYLLNAIPTLSSFHWIDPQSLQRVRIEYKAPALLVANEEADLFF